jgi:DNA-directed RNA polymerase subunit omega
MSVTESFETWHLYTRFDLSRRYFRSMMEELKEESIVNKVGGRFKLSTLIQKRLVQLNAGSRPLVQTTTENKMEIVLQEILQDKIYLDTSNEVKITSQTKESGEPDINPLSL